MKERYFTKNIEETWNVAKEILSGLDGSNVILLKGELGAGKTTFSQGLLTVAGAEGPFTSPTFLIMKQYDLKTPLIPLSQRGTQVVFKKIYHFDCYRVGPQDILDLGWEEIISNPKNLVLVEWPERIKEILPSQYCQLNFQVVGENEREIDVVIKS